MLSIHHLNCGTFCPMGGRLWTGSGPLLKRARLVCHCLLIQTGRTLALVDTGLGVADLAEFDARHGRVLRIVSGVRRGPENTAVRQVEALGFNPRDVRHVVLTHMDFDHAGGLADFPWAKVHVMAAERDAAAAQASLTERVRYRAVQWAHRPAWRTYERADGGGEKWLGFAAGNVMDEIDADVMLLPLPGHTRGHAGVAVKEGGRWLLHCGDAVVDHREVDPVQQGCPLMHRVARRVLAFNNAARIRNLENLRDLARREGDGVRLICSHDAAQFDEAL